MVRRTLALVWLGILLPLTACGPGKMVSQAHAQERHGHGGDLGRHGSSGPGDQRWGSGGNGSWNRRSGFNYGGGWHHHSDDFAGGILGGIIGGAIGSIFAPAPEPQVVIVPAPPPEAPEIIPFTPPWYQYCALKYRSFDPQLGTYTGYDGLPHACR